MMDDFEWLDFSVLLDRRTFKEIFFLQHMQSFVSLLSIVVRSRYVEASEERNEEIYHQLRPASNKKLDSGSHDCPMLLVFDHHPFIHLFSQPSKRRSW